MILIDANLLIYATNRDAPRHAAARAWLEEVLSGETEVKGLGAGHGVVVYEQAGRGWCSWPSSGSRPIPRSWSAR